MELQRRNSPRFATTVSVEIANEQGEKARASVCDLSRDGLLCELDADASGILFPGGLEESVQSAAEIDIVLPLPFVYRAHERIAAHCRVLRISPAPADSARVALRFLSFKGDAHEHVESFVLEQQRLQ